MNTTLRINSLLTLKNRAVVPPMASQTADREGDVTKSSIENYERLAISKAFLVMVEYIFVSLSGKSEPNQLGIHTDHHIEGLRSLAA